jgi:hypothetical protein
MSDKIKCTACGGTAEVVKFAGELLGAPDPVCCWMACEIRSAGREILALLKLAQEATAQEAQIQAAMNGPTYHA